MRKINFLMKALAILFAPLAIAGPAEKLVIVTPPQTLQTGSCSLRVRAQVQDHFSNPVKLQKAMKVFFSGPEGLRFYSDSKCFYEIFDSRVEKGKDKVAFYFSSSTPGAKELWVTTFSLEDDSQVETFISPSASPVPSSPSREKLSGVTVDSIDNVSETVTALKNLPGRLTTRVVFDPGMPATYYADAVNSISQVSDVMGEVLDSINLSKISLDSYKRRVSEYIDTLGSKVTIWEIGNEINGEWLGSADSVSAKISAAYDIAKAKGVKTAVTLFYNDRCWSDPANEMFSWVTHNIQNEMKQGLDYVLVSYYPDNCTAPKPNWPLVFARLGDLFPNSKIGFGELGTTVAANKARYINEYYPMSVDHPRYVGGYFWWYFKQDMVPMTKPLWQTLYDALKLP